MVACTDIDTDTDTDTETGRAVASSADAPHAPIAQVAARSRQAVAAGRRAKAKRIGPTPASAWREDHVAQAIAASHAGPSLDAGGGSRAPESVDWLRLDTLGASARTAGRSGAWAGLEAPGCGPLGITPRDVFLCVLDAFDLKERTLLGPSRSEGLVSARACLAWLLRHRLRLSWAQVSIVIRGRVAAGSSARSASRRVDRGDLCDGCSWGRLWNGRPLRDVCDELWRGMVAEAALEAEACPDAGATP